MIKMTKQEDMSKVVSPVAPGKAVSKGLNPFDVLRFFYISCAGRHHPTGL